MQLQTSATVQKNTILSKSNNKPNKLKGAVLNAVIVH